MTAYQLQYRLTVYQPRSVDSTETTILAANGTVHSDNFKVITKSGVSGWQPYLDMPKGRKGRIDLLARKTDVGQLTFRLLDKQTTSGGSNLSRWVSGFLGAGGSTIPGKVQFGGCKVLVEESTDDGTTWANFFTGRIVGCALDDLLFYTLTVQGLAADLQTARVFRGRPHSGVSYFSETCLAPLGVAVAYGGVPAVTGFTGTTNGSYWSVADSMGVDLSATSAADPYNVVPAALARMVGMYGRKVFDWFARGTQFGYPARVRMTVSGNTYEYALAGFRADRRNDGFYRITKLAIVVLSTSDPLYGALPSSGASVTALTIRPGFTEPTEDNPLLLGDVHPVQLLADLLDGKFGALSVAGAILRSYPRDSSSFTTLIADTSFPSVRFRITEPAKLADWIADNLLKPFGLALYENGSGDLVVVDVRPPTTLTGLTTLTDADLTTDAPSWGMSRGEAFGVVQVDTYTDGVLAAEDIGGYEKPFPEVPATLVVSAKQTTLFELGTLLDGDFNERKYAIDAQGLRALLGDTQQARDRLAWVNAWANTLALNVASPYAAGPVTVSVTARRTSNVTGLTVGGLVILDSDRLPDPVTNLRGGALVGRITEKSEQGLTITVRALILGPSATADAPTLGALGAGTDGSHQVTAAVTLNAASDPVVLHTAVTDTSTGSAPAEGSALWTFAYRATSAATVTLNDLPSGVRVWVRARSEPDPKKLDKVAASAWTFSTGTDYRDTTAITAPSSLATSSVSAKSARLTWTNGSSSSPVRVYLGQAATSGAASTATPALIITLPPGTTYFDLYGLDAAGPYYRPQVCHADDLGGESARAALAAVVFQATGTNATAPTPVAISVYGSRSIALTTSPERIATALPMGVPLVIVPGGQGYGVAIERAPDSGGSPGTYADLVTLDPRDVTDAGFLFADTTATGTTTYWYRAKHVQAGFDDSAYCTAISATPRPLPLDVFSQRTIYPVNRTAALTDGKYAALASSSNGVVLDETVTRDDGAAERLLVSGIQTGTATQGQTVTFDPAFQEAPLVLFRGGVLYEPRAKWGNNGDGTGSSTFTSTSPIYEDFAALDLTATGFTVRARLRQPGTATARTNDFGTSNNLTAEGASTTATTSNAPAADDTYTINVRTRIDLASGFGGSVTARLKVAIQSDATGSYVTYDSISHNLTTDEPGGTNETLDWSVPVTVSGQSSTEHFKLLVTSFAVTGDEGSSSFSVIGYDGSTGSPLHGVSYFTATDTHASKTPDTANDRITWVAMGRQ